MEQAKWIAGVDEVGRGPLAGPVIAAAVILDPNVPIAGLIDSKKISPKKRELLNDEIQKYAKAWSIGRAEVEEIDKVNILQASLLAMKRAVETLSIQPDAIQVDGTFIPDVNMPAEAIIKGDQKVQAISAASIIAKVFRDREMCEYAKQYPEYGFEQHAGYPTKKHLEALSAFGITPIHRRSYAPVRKYLTEEVD